MESENKKAEKNTLIKAIRSLDLNKLLEVLLNNPISQVNRVEFLSKACDVSEEDIRSGNINLSLTEKKDLAKQRIKSNVKKSTGLSFATGLPGGFALAGTVPADILQNMVYSIRLIQELAYIYDYEELIEQDGDLKIDGIIIFLGVMFDAEGSASLMRVTSTNAESFVADKNMDTALTGKSWVSLIKNISKVVVSKTLTRRSVVKTASKIIPVIGGVASGGLTAVSMTRAARRLNKELIKGYGSNYTENQFDKDVKVIKSEFKMTETEEKS